MKQDKINKHEQSPTGHQSFDFNRTITENYFQLAVALTRLTCIDYVKARLYIQKHGDECETEKQRLKLARARATKRECEQYFREGFFQHISDLDPDEFISRLRKVKSVTELQPFSETTGEEENDYDKCRPEGI